MSIPSLFVEIPQTSPRALCLYGQNYISPSLEEHICFALRKARPVLSSLLGGPGICSSCPLVFRPVCSEAKHSVGKRAEVCGVAQLCSDSYRLPSLIGWKLLCNKSPPPPPTWPCFCISTNCLKQFSKNLSESRLDPRESIRTRTREETNCLSSAAKRMAGFHNRALLSRETRDR